MLQHRANNFTYGSFFVYPISSLQSSLCIYIESTRFKGASTYRRLDKQCMFHLNMARAAKAPSGVDHISKTLDQIRASE